MKTYYDVLGVRRDSSPEEIKRAYHRLALQYHPDKNQSSEAAEKMREINDAYQTLSDPAAKTRYDKRLSQASARMSDYEDVGYARPPGTDYGYEAPRHTVVYERVAYYSMENLMAAAIMGAAFGLIIAASFVFLGIRLETRPGLVAAALLAAIAMLVPPVITIVQLRKTLGSDQEARIIGSIVLSVTLSFAVAAGTILSALFGYPGHIQNPICSCCGLVPICAIVGWIVGGWEGKIIKNMFPV